MTRLTAENLRKQAQKKDKRFLVGVRTGKNKGRIFWFKTRKARGRFIKDIKPLVSDQDITTSTVPKKKI